MVPALNTVNASHNPDLVRKAASAPGFLGGIIINQSTLSHLSQILAIPPHCRSSTILTPDVVRWKVTVMDRQIVEYAI
jgi:hypothetical protein